MNSFKLIKQSPQRFAIEGHLTFSSIDKKALESFRFATKIDSIEVDLKQVNTTDSAGLALLIEWLRLARRSNVHLTFKNVPYQLITLAKLTGLEKVVHIAEQNGTIAIESQKSN